MWQPDIAINIGTQSHIMTTGTSTNISDQVSWFMKEMGLHELFAYFYLVLIYYCINSTVIIETFLHVVKKVFGIFC